MSILDPRRDFDVTASDVPTICGENPYSNRRMILYKKALRLKSVDTPATLHGRKYEPIAIQKFCEQTGARVEITGKESEYKKHPVYTWLGGTVDGIATFPDGRRMILEVKCPISRTIKKDMAIPIHYIGQVQTYMFIYEMDCCVFVQYRPAGVRRPEQLEISFIEKDQKYMDLRISRLKMFWDEMVKWMAYTERVIIVIQRAWRCRVNMTARLKCANMVGKMARFCKMIDIQQTVINPPISNTSSTTLIKSVESPPPLKRQRKQQKGIYLIQD